MSKTIQKIGKNDIKVLIVIPIVCRKSKFLELLRLVLMYMYAREDNIYIYIYIYIYIDIYI